MSEISNASSLCPPLSSVNITWWRWSCPHGCLRHCLCRLKRDSCSMCIQYFLMLESTNNKLLLRGELQVGDWYFHCSFRLLWVCRAVPRAPAHETRRHSQVRFPFDHTKSREMAKRNIHISGFLAHIKFKSGKGMRKILMPRPDYVHGLAFFTVPNTARVYPILEWFTFICISTL